MSRSDNHDILRHDWCGMQADVAGNQVDLLVEILLQIHGTALAKSSHDGAGLGAESDQPVSRSNVKDPLLLAIRPVSQAATGKLPRCHLTAPAFVLAMHPEHLSRCRVQRHNRAP